MQCNVGENTTIEKIGAGAYGEIYIISQAGYKYVLKIAKDAKTERAKHVYLWNTLPENCRKYFIKPLPLPTNCKPKAGYFLHAMEHIRGVNMHDYVKYNLSIGNKNAIKIVTAMLKSAIFCLWKAGLIHMDLHMRNVLVTNDSIKIIDFGLSEKVSPLGSPKTKKELTEWFTKKYIKRLKELGFNSANPNLYAYGIKKHKMFYKPNQNLYNQMHKMSSIKLT